MDDWYLWAFAQFTKEFPELKIVSSSLQPNKDCPEVNPCIQSLHKTITEKIDPKYWSTTLLVGHSVGNQAILRFLHTKSRDTALKKSDESKDNDTGKDANKKDDYSYKFGGLFCCAGWWTIDAPTESFAPWVQFKDNFNDDSAKKIDKSAWALEISNDEYKDMTDSVNGNVTVLLSYNDQYTDNGKAETAKKFQSRLNANVVECKVGKDVKKDVKENDKIPFKHFNEKEEPIVLACLRAILKGEDVAKDEKIGQEIKKAYDSYFATN